MTRAGCNLSYDEWRTAFLQSDVEATSLICDSFGYHASFADEHLNASRTLVQDCTDEKITQAGELLKKVGNDPYSAMIHALRGGSLST